MSEGSLPAVAVAALGLGGGVVSPVETPLPVRLSVGQLRCSMPCRKPYCACKDEQKEVVPHANNVKRSAASPQPLVGLAVPGEPLRSLTRRCSSLDFSPVHDIARILSPLTVPWWLAGGWAADAHLGHVTRRHADVDVLVLNRDLAAVAEALPAVYAEIPHTGQRIEWDRQSPLEPGLEALALDVGIAPTINKLQIVVALSEGDEWVYHRGRRTLRLPLEDIGRRTPEGIPYLAPVIVLLFKSRQLRDKDHEDFLVLLPHLTVTERSWLRERIEPWRQDHPWLSSLRS